MTAPDQAPPTRPAFARHWWLWVAAGLTLLKLALVRGQPLYALGHAIHDDKLFIELARQIAEGQWLGPYNEMTLAKGPFYSLFLAANFYLGLPLTLTQHLVYVGACVVAVAALRPWLAAPWSRLLVYATLLWNPYTYEGHSMSRILRQQLTIPLALIIAGCIFALALRRSATLRARLPWAVALGLSFGCFWLTREESIWMLPAVGIGGAAVVGAAWLDGPAARRAAGWLACVTVASFALPVGAVCWQNYRHYGWFGTVEFRDGDFQAAYGALARVTSGPQLPYVPVTPEARAAIYAASPAFAKLQPHLEGAVGAHWADNQRFDAAERQLLGGWFVWALRDAVRQAGLAPDPASAMRYYRQLADEVNDACDDGRLPSRGRRSGFTPVWHAAYGEALRAQAGEYIMAALTIRDFSTHVPLSYGTDDDVRPFRDLTHNLIAPSPNSLHIVLPVSEKLAGAKMHWLGEIGRRLARVFFWAIVAAHILAFLRLVQLALERRISLALWLAFAAWASAAAEIAINLIVHAAAFPNFTPAAYAPAYPLFLLFAAIVGMDVVQAARERSAAGAAAGLAVIVPFMRRHQFPRFVLLAVIGGAAGLWFFTRPLPFEYDPAKRWPALLLPAGALRDQAYTFVVPAAAGYEANRLVGAARLLPETMRNEFRGTHISGPEDQCTIQGPDVTLDRPWLVVPVAGFPASRGNSLRVVIRQPDGNVAVDQPFGGRNPADVVFWALDVSRFQGGTARVVIEDGRTDAEGWVAAGPLQLHDSGLAAHRVQTGWEATGQTSARKLSFRLFVVLIPLALVELGSWIFRRRKNV